MHLNHTMPRSSPTFVAPRPREESYVSVADQIAAILPGQLAVAEVENLPKIRIDNSDYVLEDWLHKRQKRSGAIFSFAALKVHNGIACIGSRSRRCNASVSGLNVVVLNGAQSSKKL
jgi:hypothetical protein